LQSGSIRLAELHRLAIVFNVGNAQPVLEMGETQAAARMLGFEVAPLVIQRAEDIAPAFQGLKTRCPLLGVERILCGPTATSTANRDA
jgi:hypothetical protein